MVIIFNIFWSSKSLLQRTFHVIHMNISVFLFIILGRCRFWSGLNDSDSDTYYACKIWTLSHLVALRLCQCSLTKSLWTMKVWRCVRSESEVFNILWSEIKFLCMIDSMTSDYRLQLLQFSTRIKWNVRSELRCAKYFYLSHSHE